VPKALTSLASCAYRHGERMLQMSMIFDTGS
jgi:hypothetical protein